MTHSLKTRSLVAQCLAFFLLGINSHNIRAQVIHYDNLATPLVRGERIFPEAGNWFLAQPFHLSEATESLALTVGLSRWGAPDGEVQFSIWNGAGFPETHLGDLGVVDAANLQDVGTSPTTLPNIHFESVDLDLPMGDYFVVSDMRNLQDGRPQRGNTVLFGGLGSGDGADGASGMMLSNSFVAPPFDTGDWVSSQRIFGNPRYFQMSVTSDGRGDVLYDNLDNVRSDGNFEDFLTPGGSDGKIAQQFQLGNHTNIDQVTVSLLRTRSNASGSLSLELWHDNGLGQPVSPDDPTGKIANLGKIIDITEIPVGTFGEFSFDNLILGLDPNKSYWIVTNHAEVSGNDDVGVATVFGGDPNYPDPPNYDPTAGTNGAVYLHANRNRDPGWANLKNVFRLEHFYQAMKVEAKDHGDTVDIDILSSAIRQGLSESRYDVNFDGQVSADDRIHLIHEIENTYFGDSNLDGEFNSSDLTVVFQGGEYEDNITLNSSWAEGDWNGDGDFESGDLIIAFQDGGYEMGARAAVNVVPEPTAGVLLTIGAIAICQLRKN